MLVPGLLSGVLALAVLEAVLAAAGLARAPEAIFLAVPQVAVLGYLAARSWRRLGRKERQESDAHLETLHIGSETLAYIRQGLNEETAQKVAEVIHKIADVDAVAITDTERILGHVGNSCYRHYRGGRIITNSTRRAIERGEFTVVRDRKELDCPQEHCECAVREVVIAPLKFRGTVVGTVKLYLNRRQVIPAYVLRLARGVAQLLGIQMELVELDRQNQLLTQARLEALQAQIRPHFLFNVLNTIIMFSRTDVEHSRALLVNLAEFFRRSLKPREPFVTVEEELEYVNTYVTLEQARFGDKLKVRMKLDPRVLNLRIPVLTIQPLVENAIGHGLAPKEDGGWVMVSARIRRDELRLIVADNGVGIPPERLAHVFRAGYGQGMGLGLSNVNERLCGLYGEEYRLRLRTTPGKGTVLQARIPLSRARAEEVAAVEPESVAG